MVRVNKKMMYNTMFASILYVIFFQLVPYETRPDINNYIYVYNHYDFFVSSYDYGYIYSGFQAIFKVLNIGYFLFFIFYCFCSVLIKNVVFYTRSDYFVFSVFLYALMFFPYNELITIRVALAISIFIYGIKYIVQKDLFKYMLIGVICSLCHYSMIIIFPLYWLSKFKGNKLWIVMLFIAPMLLSSLIWFIFSLNYYYADVLSSVSLVRVVSSKMVLSYQSSSLISSKVFSNYLIDITFIIILLINCFYYRVLNDYETILLKIVNVGVILFFGSFFIPELGYRYLEILLTPIVILLPNLFKYTAKSNHYQLFVVIVSLSVLFLYANVQAFI